jgi:hypothetical protein
MTKLIIDNSSPEALQRRLEARVQVTFAKVAGTILHILCGEQAYDLINVMKEFISVYESAEKETADPNGVDILMPKLRRDEADKDEPTNAVLRGSLRAVAALLDLNAKVPIDGRGGREPTKREKKAYFKALDELTEGLALLQKRKRQSQRT